MVPYFVRNNIGHSKIAGRSKALFELVVKGKINIKMLIAGTIKWSGCRAGIATSRFNSATEKGECRGRIIFTSLLHELPPQVFSVAEDNLYKFCFFILPLLLFGRERLVLIGKRKLRIAATPT